MVSSPLQQIPSTAVDAAGLSISTSIRSATDPRPGAVYEPVNLAAAVPIYFHPTTNPSMGGANFLMLNNRRWTAATAATTNPGAYTAYTIDNNPSWVQIDAVNGTRTVMASSYEIPMNTVNDSHTLTAALSRGNTILWTLNSVTRGAVTSAVVQYWQYNTAINTLHLLTEETIPVGTNGVDSIVFDDGLRGSVTIDPYIYVYGLGSSTNQVYMARKSWARVGFVGTATAPLDYDWEVYTGTGWAADFTTAGPVVTATGPMTSVAPLSFAYYVMQRAQRGRKQGTTGYDFLSTVVANSSARSAQIFSSLGGRVWQSVGSSIALGALGSTYTGANIQFQGQVGPNPTMVDPTNSATAIPYCYTLKASGSGADSLVVNWSLMQVPRLS